MSPALKIVPAYMVVGTIYILFSDKLVNATITDPATLKTIQTYKGIGYIMATGMLLYVLIDYFIRAVKREERSKNRQDKLYLALMQSAGDLTILSDRHGKILFIGPSIHNSLGYSVEEVINLNPLSLVHPDDFDSAVAVNRLLLTKPDIPFVLQSRLRHKAGHYVWMEGTFLNKLNDPEIAGIITNARNISEAKEAEEKKMRSERLLRAAFEQVAAGMANINLQRKWERVNSEMCRISGYSPDELKDTFLENIFVESMRNSIVSNFSNAIAGIRNSGSATRRVLRKDGTTLWVETMFTLIRDEAGKPLYIAVFVKDVDKAKRNEEELIHTNKELDTFIYRSSHDLRGPITTLHGLADLGAHESTDEMTIGYFSQIQSVARHLTGLLDSLMAVTEIRQARLTLKEENIHDIIVKTLSIPAFKTTLTTMDVAIRIKPNFSAVTDATVLSIIMQQLIENVINNRDAAKAPSELSIIVTQDQDTMRITISDNGLGISQTDLPNIFDLYYKGQNNQTRNGIGLYLTRSAVNKLGGHIDVSSTAGIGTTITISLPISYEIPINTAPYPAARAYTPPVL